LHQIKANKYIVMKNKENESSFKVNDLLNLDEACDYLNITQSTMYKYTSSRKIPFYKPNKKIFFEKSDLDYWIRSNRVSSHKELEEKAISLTLQKRGK